MKRRADDGVEGWRAERAQILRYDIVEINLRHVPHEIRKLASTHAVATHNSTQYNGATIQFVRADMLCVCVCVCANTNTPLSNHTPTSKVLFTAAVDIYTSKRPKLLLCSWLISSRPKCAFSSSSALPLAYLSATPHAMPSDGYIRNDGYVMDRHSVASE